MVTTDISQSGYVFMPKNPEKPFSNKDSQELQKMGQEKIESLEEQIKQIKHQILSREKLRKNIDSECEKIKTEITNFLFENPITNTEDPLENQERSRLRQKKVDIAEMQLKERVSCWQDISELKKELREKEKELQEKKSRINFISDILKEE